MKKVFVSEAELAATAFALLPKNTRITAAERNLVEGSCEPRRGKTQDAIKKHIKQGQDPLGEAFLALRPSEVRRNLGAVYTPATIINAILEWAAAQTETPARIVDPGTGSGRFLLAAAKKFPQAKLVAVEIDPLSLLVLRANASILGISDRLTIKAQDYRDITLPKLKGATLFVGNPPYVRHHDISAASKDWYAEQAKAYGLRASKLAGLHLHFFLKTRALAKNGDYGAFITAAEWLDVNYGQTLRSLLATELGGQSLHIIDATANPFEGALTTGVISTFKIGARAAHLNVRNVASTAELKTLTTGIAIPWSQVTDNPRWSSLARPKPSSIAGSLHVGDLFRVHRGQVTGANAVWIADEAAKALPERFLYPCVTKARELIEAGPILSDPSALRRVVDLPVDLDALSDAEQATVQKFLKWAKKNGAHESYIASHRSPWWNVRLRDPAPILVTYMGRRPPVFVRNLASARHLNIAHGLYPRETLPDDLLAAIVKYLGCSVDITEGRTYAGGLVKFEPKELERLKLPTLQQLHEAIAETVDAERTGRRRGQRQKELPSRAA